MIVAFGSKVGEKPPEPSGITLPSKSYRARETSSNRYRYRNRNSPEPQVEFWKRLRRLNGSDSDFRCADSDFDLEETCREPQANPVPPAGGLSEAHAKRCLKRRWF
jgi:hypothetical protein